MNYYKIKIELERRGISIKDICRQIDVTEQGFYQMIRNESMRVDVLERISEALNVPISYWFNGKAHTPTENSGVSQPAVAVEEKKEEFINPKHIDAVTDELNKLLKELSRR